MKSTFYRGKVRHRRFSPRKREFSFRLFYPLLDVDNADGALQKLPLWSTRWWSPFRFRRRDYSDRTHNLLGQSIRNLVRDQLGRTPGGPVMLLANVRTWGFNFNPLAVYFCYADQNDTLDSIVLEVTSTPWNDRHFYVIDASGDSGSMHHASFKKAMHVSPFLDSNMEYALSYSNPGERFNLRLEALQDGIKVFDADLWLSRVEMNAKNGLFLPFRYPLLPLQVLTGIYLHAAVLLARRARYYRRAHNDNAIKVTSADIKKETNTVKRNEVPVGG